MTSFNPSPFDDSASFYDEMLSDPFQPVDLAALYPTAEEHLTKGDDFYQAYQSNPSDTRSGDALEQAVAHYRHALEIQPDLSKAYTNLASALWEQGNISLENALHYCELAIQFEPGEVSHYLSQGRFLLESGQPVQSIVYFQRALAISVMPQPKTHQYLAKAYFQVLGQPIPPSLSVQNQRPVDVVSPVSVNQLKTFSQAAYHWALSKTLTLVTPAKVSVLASTHPSKTSVVSIKPVVKSSHPAQGFFQVASRVVDATLPTTFRTPYYRWVTQHVSQHPQLLKSLAHCYVTDGQLTDAIQTYQRAVELNPVDVEAHHTLGVLFTQVEEIEQAQLHFDKVVSLNPSHFNALYELGHIYTDKQDYMRALYYFKEATKQTQHHPYLLSNMAYVLFKLGDMEGAVAAYNDALEYGTDNVWRSAVAQTLGALYYQTFDDDEAAKEAFSLALTLDPNNTEAAMMLAELLFEDGDFQSALALYEEIDARGSANANVYSHVGYILWQMDRNDEALTSYNKALRLDSENAIVYNNMGVIYLDEMFDAQKASLMFEKALLYNPNYTLACFNMGRSMELLGKTTEAAQHYSDALNLNIFNPELESQEIEDRLHLLFEV